MQDNNKEVLNLLKTAKGQIDSVVKMTEENRYCVDISNQVNAVMSLLKKANLSILKNHIETCVRDSFVEGTQEEKTQEVIDVLRNYMK